MRLNEFWCSLCGCYHTSSQLAKGWYAVGLRHNKRGADSAKRLICSKCLARLGAGLPNDSEKNVKGVTVNE